MKVNLKKIHSECGWHKKAILRSELCGCFNCLSIFSPLNITEWIEESPSCPRGAGKTAMCPKCNIDSVLPDSIDGGISIELLQLMNQEYM